MPSPAEFDLNAMIQRSARIKGGTPHIAGTGVTVRTIARWYKLGLSAEQIAAEIPHLSLAQIYAGLAYYHGNRDELERELATEDAASDELEEQFLRTRGKAA